MWPCKGVGGYQEAGIARGMGEASTDHQRGGERVESGSADSLPLRRHSSALLPVWVKFAADPSCADNLLGESGIVSEVGIRRPSHRTAFNYRMKFIFGDAAPGLWVVEQMLSRPEIFKLSVGCFPVPRADILADVASENPILNHLFFIRADLLLELNRQIGDAFASIHTVGFGDRIGRACIDAPGAGSAVIADGSIIDKGDINDHLSDKKPRAVLFVQDVAVFTHPSDS